MGLDFWFRRLFLSFLVLFMLAMVPCPVWSQVYFVAPGGDDGNPGTLSSPKRTIQSVIEQLGAGDTLFLREGTYHEEVAMTGLKGSMELPVVIMAYQGETVTLDGTTDLQELKVPGAVWEPASERFPGTGSIYKLQLQEDIWQLFVQQPELMTTPNAVGGELAGYRMQVVARWPNASTHPCDPAERVPGGTDIVNGNWWSFRSTWADASAEGTTFTSIECVPSYHSLASTGVSFEGGTAILSVISQGPANIAVKILDHEAGTNYFTHTGTDPSHEYHKERHFIVEHLNALDQPGEWYFEDSTKTVYLWPEDNLDPNGKNIRGRTQTRAFDLDNCSHISFLGLGLFATTVRLDGEHISFTDCAISYPDMPKRVLGIHDDDGPAIDARDCWYFGMKNCVVEYSQYHIIQVKNVGSVFDNNYFHHLGMMGMGTTGCFMNVNTFTRNTLQTIGHRAAVKANSSPESGRNQSWNILNGWGYLYANDGVGFQTSQGGSVGSVRAYNWFIRSEKPGHRYDGPDEGKGFPTLGLSHHLVGLRTKSVSTNIKGDYNQVYNYLAIQSTNEDGGIAIRWNTETGEGNAHTIMRNCAADGINLGKWAPLPCIHSNNYDASKRGGSILEMIPAADLLDFRPGFNTPLVNSGFVVEGINDSYLGAAPDIGAYEWGDDTYWIPGYRKPSTSIPIPFDGAMNMPVDRDLIFLHGYESEEAILYFGTDETSVLNADTGSAFIPGEADPDAGEVLFLRLDSGRNIVTPTMLYGNPNSFDPAPYLLKDDPTIGLSANQTYYWRADALKEDGTFLKGEVWSFSTGDQTYHVSHRVIGRKEGDLFPLEGVMVSMDGEPMKTDSLGSTYGIRLSPGNAYYRIEKKGYTSSQGSLSINSDTVIEDTLDFTTYHATMVLIDNESGIAIPGADLILGQGTYVTDSAGAILIEDIEYAIYPVTAHAENYLPVTETFVEINSDTTIIIRLEPHYLLASLTVLDLSTGLPLERALISFCERIIPTTGSGAATLEKLRKGTLVYTIEHRDYFPVTDSLVMTVDTSFVVMLTPKMADIQFDIVDASGPVSGAQVALNGVLMANSDSEGTVRFINKLAREYYSYSVDSEGYETTADSLYLELDTVVKVMLQPLTSFEDAVLSDFTVYPNPISHRINYESEEELASVWIMDMGGKLWIHRNRPGNTIIVSSLPAGFYLAAFELESGKRVFRKIEKTGL